MPPSIGAASTMKRPAIFFDRDNTLIANDGYLGDPEKVVLVDGAADAVARARALGFATVVVSNQSGVARGMFDEAAVQAVNRRMDQMLLRENAAAVIDRHEFCPYHPEATVEQYRQDSTLRKPRPGMIMSAADRLALDLKRSWVIGDAPRDVEAGKAAGCHTILLHLPHAAQSPAAAEKLGAEPDYHAANLKEAMDFIENNRIAPEEHPQRSPQAMASPAPLRPAPSPAAEDEPGMRLERLAEQILEELRTLNRNDHYSDFSVSKLMAGIVQVLALASLLLSYLNRSSPSFPSYMLTTIFLQTLTISLLIMGRQR
jgi:D-glycero-D-manno-heptose 1,7-bisphosphate phosphatase